jgi:lambda repressor-like predicted transcriptional regulator
MQENQPQPGAAGGLPMNLQAALATAFHVQQLVVPGINPDGSLRPEAFRALMKLKGVNIRALAELHGFDDSTFHHVVNRLYRNEVAENIIAEALGLRAVADLIWGRRASTAA